MGSFVKEEIETKISGEYDVIVVGGGPSGTTAAIAASRNGAKTLLIEKFNCLGGMWTVGMVNPLFDSENKSGIIREIVDDLVKKKAWGGFWNRSFHYEYMKSLIENKCVASGVDILFDTNYSRVIKDGNTVKGIIVDNVARRQSYLGKVIIDCTGDASVAEDAGAKILIGDENGTCQAMTLMFIVGNIPDKYINGLMFYNKIAPMFKKRGIEVPFTAPFLIPVPNSHFAVMQYTHMRKCNPLSPKDITMANIEGRRQMIELIEILKEDDEEFKDLDLIMSAPIMGIRESRRIDGEYTLTINDLVNGTDFDDGFTRPKFNVDIHCEDGTGQYCIKVENYQIPFRSLIPKGLEGILVAGKTISGTHEAMASYRVTADCSAMGEAAGTAAAWVCKTGNSVRDVKILEIMEEI